MGFLNNAKSGKFNPEIDYQPKHVMLSYLFDNLE